MCVCICIALMEVRLVRVGEGRLLESAGKRSGNRLSCIRRSGTDHNCRAIDKVYVRLETSTIHVLLLRF